MRVWPVLCLIGGVCAHLTAKDGFRQSRSLGDVRDILRYYLEDTPMIESSQYPHSSYNKTHSKHNTIIEKADKILLPVEKRRLVKIGGAAHYKKPPVKMVSQPRLQLGGAAHLEAAPIRGRITGGVDSDIRNHPYLLQLGINGNQHCSASIINGLWAITVASCLYDRHTQTRIPDYLLTLRAGAAMRNVGGRIHRPSVTIIHDRYRHLSNTHDFDISVIKVRSAFNFSPLVEPITLPQQGQRVRDEVPVAVSGWGALDLSTDDSEVLQTINIKTVNQNQCQNNFQTPITQRMVCASDGRKGACKRDEGGALVANRVLIGLYSWGDVRCSLTGIPGVYTRVPEFRNWIKNSINI